MSATMPMRDTWGRHGHSSRPMPPGGGRPVPRSERVDVREPVLASVDQVRAVGDHVIEVVVSRGEAVDDRIGVDADGAGPLDRKSTRLNSSHVANSYAVF